MHTHRGDVLQAEPMCCCIADVFSRDTANGVEARSRQVAENRVRERFLRARQRNISTHKWH